MSQEEIAAILHTRECQVLYMLSTLYKFSTFYMFCWVFLDDYNGDPLNFDHNSCMRNTEYARGAAKNFIKSQMQWTFTVLVSITTAIQ